MKIWEIGLNKLRRRLEDKMLKEISIGAVVVGVIISTIGHKSEKAVKLGSLILILGLLGIYFFS